MNINKDYYKILELTNQAEITQIKKKYKTLALKLHPDRNKGNKEKEEQFKEVSEAYSILSNPKSKQEYDKMSPYGRNYIGANPFGGFSSFGDDPFDDIFSTIFGRNPFDDIFGKKSTYQEFKENLDIEVNVIISLRDVYLNEPFTIKYKRNKHCSDCDGTGFNKDGHFDVCEICDGKGVDKYGRICEYCRGEGKIYSETCKKCNGEKVIEVDEKFQLQNIQSVRDNNTQYLRGRGHQSKYYRNKHGNLILNIVYEHIQNYKIKNNDLYYKLNIHYQDAINGKKIKYEHLDSKIIEIKIPKKTKDGDIIKIKNKGLLINKIDRGDLYLKINIIIDYDKI